MKEIPAMDRDSEGYQEACDWFVRLRETPDDPDLVANWLSWCRSDPVHRELFEQARQSWVDLGAGAARCASMPAIRPAPRTSRPLWKVAAAAVFAVAAAGIGWLLAGSSSWFGGGDASTFATTRTEHRSVLLADGSQVEMAGNSRLRVILRARSRDIELERGEAYFNVAHDKSRPFVVHAGDLHVRAVGTRFDVRTTSGRGVVAVEEGVVVVEPPGIAAAAVDAVTARFPALKGKSQVVRPLRPTPVRSGQEIAVGAPDQEVQLLPIEPQAVASWRQGRLRFAREPLQSVIDSIRSVSGQDIELADPSIGDLRFTGTVFSSRVEAWVNALPAIFPVAVHQDGARLIITHRVEPPR